MKFIHVCYIEFWSNAQSKYNVLEKFAVLVNKIRVIFLRKFKNRGKLGLIKEIFDSDPDKIKEKKWKFYNEQLHS